jgi:3',5'-cyclic-AMP phosphodiesterase
VTLDLRGVDPGRPDGRALVAAEPPSFALHRWDGERLVTHFQSVRNDGEWPVLARFTPKMQAVVQTTFAERGS